VVARATPSRAEQLMAGVPQDVVDKVMGNAIRMLSLDL
jgi:hypothetical protein